jgi:hypothetical protein
MTATLMQLRRLVRSRVGIPISDDYLTDPVLDDHINLAVEAIDAEYRWPWNEVVETVTVTPAAPDIPEPVGWRATRAVFHDGYELGSIAPADLLTWATASGVPRVWCPMPDVIAVRPVAQNDTELVHLWARQPVWLRKDEDTLVMPEQFLGSVVAKAAQLLAVREGGGADAARHDDEYKNWLARMRRDVRGSTTPTRIRVRPGGWI